MKVTKQLLKELYVQYNEKYFGGVLGECDFFLIPKTDGTLGFYRTKMDRCGKLRDRIWIGTSVVWNDELLRNVLVHEMAHMYVHRINGRRHDGLLGHGRYFRKQVRRIKRDFGFDIDDRFEKVEYLNPKFQIRLWERLILWIIDR